MEFGEKLQELRKARKLTQEELAEALYVSRTAISKWESGRGYPSIDSLKEISSFFGVSIDELLSSEKLISIAEKENKSNLQKLYNIFFGISDLFAIFLIVLPLYPLAINGYIYSTNLLSYSGGSIINMAIHWLLFLTLIGLGIFKILLTQLGSDRFQDVIRNTSLGISILTVLYLSIAREPYAIIVAFLLFAVKGLLFIKR